MVYLKPTGKHRKVWEDVHGSKIPKGYAVHHIDKNTSNNNPNNLEIIPRGKHQSDHVKERLKDPEKMKELLLNLNKAQEKAKEWHRSKKGKKWHKEQYKNTLAKAKKYKRTCVQCGKEYFTTRKVKTRFCQHRCSQNYYYKQRGDNYKKK